MANSPHIGLVLQDTYRVERLITHGGMGTLYEAAHLRLSRRFAVKILSPSFAAYPEALLRFQREADVTSALGHPNILEVIDFNKTPDGLPYIVMELLEGEDLGQRLEQRGRLALPEALSIFLQVASALSAAHEKGIVHRDLKPPNIFLCRRAGRDDFVKVVDFGISKVLGAEMTRTNVILGSPAHMAPEQADGRPADVDARSDVYSLGAILFEVLSGRPPFVEDTLSRLLDQIVRAPAPPLRSLCPEVPAGVEAAVARALSKRREDRFASMTEFAAAMDAAAPGGLRASGGIAALAAAEFDDEGSFADLSFDRTLVNAPTATMALWGAPGHVTFVPGRSLSGEEDVDDSEQQDRTRAIDAPGPRALRDAPVPVAVPPLRPFLLGALASAALGVCGFLIAFLIGRAVPREGREAKAQPPAAAPRAPAKAPKVAPPPAAVQVRLGLVGLPPGARVLIDGVEHPERPLLLPRSTTQRRLRVEAPGFQREERALTPQRDEVIVFSPTPQQRQ